MKIGLVAFSDFQHYPVGGGLSFLREFVQASTARTDVEIVLVGWSDVRTPDRAVKQVRIGAREYPFIPVGGGVPPRVVPDRTVFHGSVAGWKSAVDRMQDVDVMYCHSPESVLGMRRGGARVPVVIHLHGSRDAIGRSRFLIGRIPPIKWLYQKLVLAPALAQADAVLATISEDEHRLLKRSGSLRPGVPCLRIPGMVSARLGALRMRAGDGGINLVCVGRLEPVKGVELPIGAVAELARRGVECHLKVVGDGSDRKRLERMVAERKVTDRVTFLGTCDPTDVARHLGDADIFVSGSRQEGFSLALLEALAIGRPAVVTQVGSAGEVVIPGSTGEIVAGRDPRLFADSVLRVKKYGRECALACHDIAMTYSSPRVAARILEVLEGMVRSARTSPTSLESPVATASKGRL